MKTVAYYRHLQGKIRELADDGYRLWFRVVKHQPGCDDGPVPTRWEQSGRRTLADLHALWCGSWTRISMCSRRRT